MPDRSLRARPTAQPLAFDTRRARARVIWTARPWEAAQDTVARLTEWGVDWHGIRMENGNADTYVDDKGTTPKEELVEDGCDGDGELDADETEGNGTDPERADTQKAKDDGEDDSLDATTSEETGDTDGQEDGPQND